MNTPPPVSISHHTLAKLYRGRGLQRPTRDGTYFLAKRSWLLGAFKTYFLAEMERLGLTKYKKGRNDCDDFADEWVRAARRCMARMVQEFDGTVAVGYTELWATWTKPQGWHAIGTAVVEGEETIYIDPAPGFYREVEIDLSVNRIRRTEF